MEQISELNCIVCLQVHDIMVHLYHDFEDLQTSLLHLLETCGGLKIIEDVAYPKYLCKICTNELLVAAKFREKCLASQKILENRRKQLANGNDTNYMDLIEVDYGDIDDTCNDHNANGKKKNVYSNETQNESQKNSKVKTEKHEKYKAMTCCKCGAVFQQKSKLIKHLQCDHGITKYYSCLKCETILTSKTEYEQHDCHKNNNTINKINECLICKKNFQTPFALRMHSRSHMGGPFICKFCNKEFITESILKAHTRRHTEEAEFKCTICNKPFFEQRNFDAHMRIHNNDRQHECTICKRSFSGAFLLELHMRLHTSEKSIVCALK